MIHESTLVGLTKVRWDESIICYIIVLEKALQYKLWIQ